MIIEYERLEPKTDEALRFYGVKLESQTDEVLGLYGMRGLNDYMVWQTRMSIWYERLESQIDEALGLYGMRG